MTDTRDHAPLKGLFVVPEGLFVIGSRGVVVPGISVQYLLSMGLEIRQAEHADPLASFPGQRILRATFDPRGYEFKGHHVNSANCVIPVNPVNHINCKPRQLSTCSPTQPPYCLFLL